MESSDFARMIDDDDKDTSPIEFVRSANLSMSGIHHNFDSLNDSKAVSVRARNDDKFEKVHESDKDVGKILMAYGLAIFSSGFLQYNLATFLAVYVDGKFNHS